MRRLSICVFVLTAACNRKPKAPDKYEYHVFVDRQAEAAEMDGKPLAGGKSVGTGTTYSVTIPSGEYATDHKFTVTLKTTCGTEKVPATLEVGLSKASDHSGEDRERKDTKPGEKVLSSLAYSAPERARVFLDTSDSAAGPVEVGGMPLQMDKAEQEIPVGNCPTARDVKVGGKVVGKLNDKGRTKSGASGKSEKIPATTLIDACGKHCFEKVIHVYVDKQQDTSNMDRGKPKKLEGSYVYAEDIDDFLKPSPKELTASADDVPIRTEIRHCSAKGGAK